MYSPAVLDHFKHPRNAGVLEAANAAGRAQNPGCGDEVELTLRVAGSAVEEARFRARGCAPVIACASRLTELVRGLPVSAALALDAEALATDLGGLPATSRHAAHLPVEALRAALASAAAAPWKNSVPG